MVRGDASVRPGAHPGHWTRVLRAAYPLEADALVFLRWQGQPDDVYAVYDADPGFAVQIDPDLDYIIIWGGSARGEYAEWLPGDDPVAAALEHIAQGMGPPADR